MWQFCHLKSEQLSSCTKLPPSRWLVWAMQVLHLHPACFTLDTNYSALLNTYIPPCMSLSCSSNMPAYLCFQASKHCAYMHITTSMHMSSLTYFDFTPKVQCGHLPHRASFAKPAVASLLLWSEEQCPSSSCQSQLCLLPCSVPGSWRQHCCLSKLVQRAGLAENFSPSRDEFPADGVSDWVNHAHCLGRGGVKNQSETAATWISSICYWKQQFCLLFSGFIHMEVIKLLQILKT